MKERGRERSIVGLNPGGRKDSQTTRCKYEYFPCTSGGEAGRREQAKHSCKNLVPERASPVSSRVVSLVT